LCGGSRHSWRLPIGVATLGFDVGTSSMKGVVVDAHGGIRASARRSYPLMYPGPGRVEADAEQVWTAFMSVTSTLATRASRDGLSIRAIAGSVSVDESVFVDARGRPLGPVIMAPDTHASVTSWNSGAFPDAERLYAITGLPPYPVHAVPRLIWFRRRRKSQFARLAGVWDWAAYIASRLGLPATTDRSVAARTMAWDVRAGTWSRDILDAAGLNADLFPRVVEAGSVIGDVPGATGKALGLSRDTALVAGGMDQWLAAIGTGVTDAGQAMVGTGTWEAIAAPLTGFPVSLDLLRMSGISLGPYFGGARYAAMASQIGGGALVSWFRDVFAPSASLGDLVRSVGDWPTGLLVLPHVAGSLSPWMDAGSRAAITGLGLNTDRRTLLRAVMEGSAFELRENLSRIEAAGVRIGELRASGSGARSAAWLQLKADVLGRPVAAVNVSAHAAYGAGLLAGSAVGSLASLRTTIRERVRPTQIYDPRAAVSAAYDEIFRRYRQLYPALRSPQWTRLRR
jgi:xylulokinase